MQKEEIDALVQRALSAVPVDGMSLKEREALASIARLVTNLLQNINDIAKRGVGQ